MLYRHLFIFMITAMTSVLIFSCKDEESGSDQLSDLPIDTGGVHLSVRLGSVNSPLGYYAYLPSGYEETDQSYPLLIFLHGSGERGNSQVNADNLDFVLRNGPPRLIEQEKWNPTFPMIVISPQSENWWNPEQIREMLKHIMDEYRINESRIYLTGLSMGGFGTFNYIQNYGDSSFIAAAIPICGGGNTNRATSFRTIPVWAFHGDADGTVDVNNSINMVEAINAIDSGLVHQAKLTIYPGVGHNSWSRTYDGTGMDTEHDDYDPFDESIYDWFFSYSLRN